MTFFDSYPTKTPGLTAREAYQAGLPGCWDQVIDMSYETGPLKHIDLKAELAKLALPAQPSEVDGK